MNKPSVIDFLVPVKKLFPKWKKLLIILGVVLMVLSTLGFGKFGLIGFTSEVLRNPSTNPNAENPMTLNQAWDIIYNQAKQYNSDIQIVSIGSVGNQGSTSSSGRDGKRRAWQGIAVSSDNEWWITIVDGKVTDTVKQPKSGNFTPLEKPTLDSPEAINQALKLKPSLTPETDLGWGYHFNLENIKDEKSGETRALAITVIGSYNRRSSIVSINANDGNLEQAKIQMLGGGGILYSQDAGETWMPSNLKDIFVSRVTKDLWVDKRAYAATTKGGRISIYMTEDGGTIWQPWGTLPPNAEDWAFAIEVVGSDESSKKILVGTWSGLWSSSDGQNWSLVENLPAGPKQWMGQARSGKDYRLLVTITDGLNKGLYSSSDLVSWEKMSKRIYRLSESYDKKSVLATDDDNIQDKDTFLKFDTKEKKSLPISGQVSVAAGDFDGIFVMREQSKGFGKYHNLKETGAWDKSSDGISIDVSPNFPSDNVGVIGGFRKGIFHTSDGGKSWKKVLDNPNSLVQGTNEISDVKFLSPTFVVAVNLGKLIWVDF